jgi:hypothetical protein
MPFLLTPSAWRSIKEVRDKKKQESKMTKKEKREIDSMKSKIERLEKRTEMMADLLLDTVKALKKEKTQVDAIGVIMSLTGDDE